VQVTTINTPDEPALVTRDIGRAVKVLRDGGLVALPTETVYGLGADASNPDAVSRIYAAKGRPTDHPVIVHVASADALGVWAQHVPDYALALVDRFWPGPLTIVVERSGATPDAVTGGSATVALRCPDHPVARELLSEFGGGIAAPSANRFGRVSPTTTQHVLDELSDVLDSERDVVLAGEPARVGVESTIIDCTGASPRLLRPGGVSASDVEAVTGLPLLGADGQVRAPGTLEAHYAPAARVLLADPASVDDVVAAAPDGEIGVIALASVDLLGERPVHRLVAPFDENEYAQDLYAALRRADDLGLVAVVAVLPPEAGIGSAVRDRLRRASRGYPTFLEG
jgi:L-threonylcarbamoyladenylate synthase